MRQHQQLHFCTSDYFTAAATTTPAPAATSPRQRLPVLHQQLPALHRWPSCNSDYQFCTSSCQSYTSDHLPAPADTNDYQSRTSDRLPAPAITFLHQQIPTSTSPGPATTYLHQQIPVIHQRPPIQRIPVLYQLSRSAPTITIRPQRLFAVRFFRFTIRHNKVWPFKATSLFCHSCLVRCQSLIFKRFLCSVSSWMTCLGYPLMCMCDKIAWFRKNMFWMVFVSGGRSERRRYRLLKSLGSCDKNCFSWNAGRYLFTFYGI